MELTTDFETGLIEQIRQDALFARVLLHEVDEVLLTNDAATARSMLRVLITGTVGFDTLAASLSLPGPSLQKMLSQDTNADTASLKSLAKALKLAFGVTPS